MSTTTPHVMLWFAILSAMLALAVGEVAANETNGTSSESPKPVGPVTTDASPPREAVTDIFAAPLASFKVPVPPSTEEEMQLAGLPLGKAENGTEATTAPPFSNLWFNAGQSLGSAANSLTGWLNSRLSPQTTTTTTKPPEVIVRFEQGQRKPLITIEPNRNQDNRIKPDKSQEDEDEDDDDGVDDDEDYDADGEDEQANDEELADEEEPKPNRYSGSQDEQEDDDEESNDEEELDEDEEEEVPVKKRTKYVKKSPKRTTRRGYVYKDDDDYEEDYEDDDDDDDYDYAPPNSARQQQQQSLLNRFRQLTQMQYSSNNKKQSTNQPNRGYRPVRIVQNGQVIQLVEDRPSQQKVKRQRRPGTGQPAYQLIPIQTGQMTSGGGSGGQQQNKRRVNKPDTANNIYIPLPQGTSDNKKPGQYITIPWSQLGITNNQQDYSQNGQQSTPFVVNLQQLQNSNRRRPSAQMPTNAVTNPQRKRLKRPTQNQNSQMVSLLTEQNIRDIFRVPQIPPSRTPMDDNSPVKRKRPLKPLEVPVDDDSTSKPLPINPETEVMSEENDDDDSQDESQDPYIIVGDDDSNDEPMSRHASASSFMHIGGMKPYVDVLNKGRIYLKPGRELRMSRELQPDNRQPITAINPELIDEADKDVIRSLKITTESSSEAKPNDPPSLFVLGPEDASTPGNPLPPPPQQ